MVGWHFQCFGLIKLGDLAYKLCGSRKYQRPPWNGKSLGVRGANQRVFRGGGMDIFWNHTLMKEASFTYKIITT